MLVLSRMRHERLIIASGEIIIAVDDIDQRRKSVRLSVSAGPHAIIPLIQGGCETGAALPEGMPQVTRTSEMKQLPQVVPGMQLIDCLEDDAFRIGREVTISVLRVRPLSVRLGIQATMDIPVHREEIYEALRRGGTYP